MKFRGLSLALAAVLALGLATSAAHAATYTLQTGPYDPDGDGPLGPDTTANFTLTLPDKITSPLINQVLDSCSISTAGYSCTTSTFYTKHNPFGGTDDYIGFNSSSPDGSGTGFLFFQHGALQHNGVYTNLLYPANTPGFGNFAFATLTVTDIVTTTPVPAALPLLASGLAGLGVVALRRRRKT